MQKKILSILIALFALCTLSVVAFAEDAVYVEIGTADELLALMSEGDDWVAAAEEATDEEKAAAEAAKTVHADKLALSYKLVADIDLSAVEGQTPIGRREIPFTGIFDGDGHTIKGLNIDGSNGEFKETALFGGTFGATILNLTVEGSVKSNGNNVGGIVGRAVLPLTVKNCVNKATVDMNVIGKMIGIGGIVASCVLGEETEVELTVENCTNYAAVKSMSNKSAYISGIVGYIQARKGVDNPYLLTVNVSNCVNYAPLSAEFATVGGGVVGYADFAGAGISGTFTLENCANFGKVHAMSYNGGVLGAVGGDKGTTGMTFTLKNLFNAGEISGTSDSSSNSGAVVGLIRFPAPVDGVAPVEVSYLMDTANSGISVIGGYEETPDTSATFNGLCSTAGTSAVFYHEITNGALPSDGTVTVNITNSAYANATEEELAAFVASAPEVWSLVEGKPTLTYFTDIIKDAENVEVIGSSSASQPFIPNITPIIPPKTEVTTAAPVTTAPVVDGSSEGGAPVGVIVGIIAAVVVVAIVVVVVVKKNK